MIVERLQALAEIDAFKRVAVCESVAAQGSDRVGDCDSCYSVAIVERAAFDGINGGRNSDGGEISTILKRAVPDRGNAARDIKPVSQTCAVSKQIGSDRGGALSEGDVIQIGAVCKWAVL